MRFINLTPHTISVSVADVVRSFPPSGQTARVLARAQNTGFIDGIPVSKQLFGEVEGLSDPVAGTILIVSGLVLSRVESRSDVVAPDSGDTAIRKNGQIVAVRGFICK